MDSVSPSRKLQLRLLLVSASLYLLFGLVCVALMALRLAGIGETFLPPIDYGRVGMMGVASLAMAYLAYQAHSGSPHLKRIVILAAGGLFAGGASIMGPLYVFVFGVGLGLILLAVLDIWESDNET